MMKQPKHEPVYIRDASRMRNSPPHGFIHWILAFLLMTAFAGSLWQHGHAGLTIGLLLAVPVLAATVYIPYRFFSSLARSIACCLLFGAALCWLLYRINKSQPDLLLVESLCIASLIFVAGGKQKDYFYLFFISIFLLIYGSLVPRMIHLYLSCTAVLLLLFIAFAFRNQILSGRTVVREIPSLFVRLWHPAAVQLLLSGILFWYIFALMPLQNNDIPGLFETSFLTSRETVLPPEFNQWLRPKKTKISDRGRTAASGESPVKPSAAGDQGKPASIPDSSSKSMIEGSGAASQGQEQVFYVKSPVKLYHLARLYDSYDGMQWKASSQLKRVRIREHKGSSSIRTCLTDQKYTLVKLISNRLYSGFMPVSFVCDRNTDMFHSEIKSTFYGAELCRTPLNLPFAYTVSVRIPLLLRDPELSGSRHTVKKGGKSLPSPDTAWVENISKKHYLRLPAGKISKRVRALAGKIISGTGKTSYGKAVALRDYLRENYSYKLHAAKVPPGKEPADYFLFELKEGHCEYFACALAVLARAAGLPARVATGFSPGNYNTLSNLFEVYEYHAHAWTQIYIEQLGWLTMDATPPAFLQSRTLPAGIGQLRDPFGDEWKITPPELTKKTQDFLKNDLLDQLNRTNELSVIDSTLVEIVEAQEKIEKNVQGKYQSTIEKIKDSRKKGWIFRLRKFWDTATRYFRKGFRSLYDFISSAWPGLLAAALLIYAGVKTVRFYYGVWKSGRLIRRIVQLRRNAEKAAESDARQAVLDIYRAMRHYLAFSGYERRSCELLDFADRIALTDRKLSEAAREIFILYYRAEYSGHPVTSGDASRAIVLFDSVCSDAEPAPRSH